MRKVYRFFPASDVLLLISFVKKIINYALLCFNDIFKSVEKQIETATYIWLQAS